VDNADRIYVVVQSSYGGIIELNEDGSFSRYFGVNEPQINMVDFLWKSIASDKQKEKMGKTYAPAFNNVTLDGEGFVMAVTSDSASADMVFRLNFAGANVLREMGNTMVIGDLKTENPSAFVDIAVKPYGTYAVLDKTYGHVFLYNFDGELQCVFGSKGSAVGQFKTPSSIVWLGDKLVIGDADLKCAYIYEPTAFGSALLKAGEAYYNGEWDTATAYFEEVLRLCANLETAYVGIGKNLLMKEDYEGAMYNFKLGNNREFYSKAYKGYRTIVMKENFWIIAIVAVVFIGAVLGSEVSYHQKQKRRMR
nr:gluconolactonase [Clostridia bacterium]